MHKLHRIILLFFLCSLALPSLAQTNEEIFLDIVDTLDRIQAPKLEKVKEKGRVYVIKVKNQQSFDNIGHAVKQAIDAGKTNISVKICQGLYHFRDNHISLSDISHPDVSIRIEGNNAIITSDQGYEKGNGIISPYDEMKVMDGPVIIVDSLRKLCKIPYKNKIDKNKCQHYSKVQITEWFKAPVYDVARIDESGIYFFAPDLKIVSVYKRRGYNVNYDCLYIEKIPRFRLYDKTKEPNCVASQLITLNNCQFRKFCISGIKFISNASSKALIEIKNTDTKQTIVENCIFEYIRGNVLNAIGSCNISFCNNIVRNTSGNELRFIKNCPQVRVTDNLFENCGQAIGNTFCVTCWESEYYIANNVFRDFGYGAIGVGVWRGHEKKWPSKGIIEYNDIYYTSNYFTNYFKSTLMDSGAIYSWTQNDEVIIRYNFIHDYIGSGNNRGVFCDDGASNLILYGNVVTNIPNCYCIDARREVELSDGIENNENNIMVYNILDGTVCFMGSEDEEKHVKKGSNYIVRGNHESIYPNKLSRLELEMQDVVLDENDIVTAIKKLPLKYKKRLLKVVKRKQT